MRWSEFTAMQPSWVLIVGMMIVSGMIGSGVGQIFKKSGGATFVGAVLGILFAILGLSVFGFDWSSNKLWVGGIAGCSAFSASDAAK